MKLIHLSDLHFGKKLHEHSLLEDQKFICDEILNIIKEEKPDAVLIAGDVYDKSLPSVEASSLASDFFTELANLKIKTLVISGNHDSAERMNCFSDLIRLSGIHIAHPYDGSTQKIVLEDEFGPVNIYLLPFIKPVDVKHFNQEAAENITDYDSAVRFAIEGMNLDLLERNVLVAHQFVTGASTSDSETFSVGGLDNVGVDAFSAFNYVALGHIHKPQALSSTLRYCGTPLKYSFSEAEHNKSVTVINLDKEGKVQIEEIALRPLHDLVEIEGKYSELMNNDFYKDFPQNERGELKDYYHITLTDEDDIIDAARKLRSIYKNLLLLSYQGREVETLAGLDEDALEKKSELELCMNFFEDQNGRLIYDEEKALLIEVIESLRRE